MCWPHESARDAPDDGGGKNDREPGRRAVAATDGIRELPSRLFRPRWDCGFYWRKVRLWNSEIKEGWISPSRLQNQ